MSAPHAEPYHLALARLRERLRDGHFAPGARIAATEVAETLHLSATPVREALSRLAGEGLLEDRRGHGFYLRALSGGDVADLFRLSLSQLLIAQDPHRERPPPQGTEAPEGGEPDEIDPVAQVERLFTRWVAEARSRTLSAAFRTTLILLGPIRRAEPKLLHDLPAEADDLQALVAAEAVAARAPALRRFHLRRVALADRLAALAYHGSQSSKE